MKCLRSGYCCFQLEVMIIDDPELGLIPGNVIHKPTGERCPHLRGDSPSSFKCSIHDKDWYDGTPCYDFGQVEQSPTDNCRLGQYQLEQIAEFGNPHWLK